MTTSGFLKIGPAFGADPMRFVSVDRKTWKKKVSYFR
jgi:hypothetical protein